MGRLLQFCIIPLAPHGGDFRCRRLHTYDTQSLLYRVTGTSEADFTSGPRTRAFSNIGKSSEMLNLCLAFQMCFRAVAPPNGLTRIGRLNHLVCYFTFLDTWSVSHSRMVAFTLAAIGLDVIEVSQFQWLSLQRWLIFLSRIPFLRYLLKIKLLFYSH